MAGGEAENGGKEINDEPLAHSGSRHMPGEACDLMYMCGLAAKACMAQRSVVRLLLSKRLWVRLSVPHFLFLNKSKEPGSESTGIGLLSARNLMGLDSESVRT